MGKAKKLSKGERIKLRIKKATERAERDLANQIAKIQGVKDKHADKTSKLREKLKAIKASAKDKVKAAKDALVKKFEGKIEKLQKWNAAKLEKIEKRHASKTEKAVKKAVRASERDSAKKLKKLARFVKLASQLGEAKAVAPKPAVKVTAKTHPENQPTT